MKQVIALFLAKLDGSGVPRVMINLAEGFRERGFEVDLVTGNAGGALGAAVPSGVELVDLGVSRVIRTLPGLVTYLRDAQPRALISAEDHSNLVALWARRLAGARQTRLAVTGHVLYSRRSGRSVFDRGYWVLRGITRFYPWAQSVSTVSAGLADDMAKSLKYPREEISVIYNPVVTPALMDRGKGPAPHRWFTDRKGPVIIGVGRLSEAKNFEVLVQAVARLETVRCLIVGEGPRRSALEALIHELEVDGRVQLLGFQANPYLYMAHADALVLSSRFEGLPTVLIEAIALGCPVVSTDCPHGPREILDNGRLGPLVQIDNADALANAIWSVIGDPISKDVLKAGAADFHVERIVEAYIDALGLYCFDTCDGTSEALH